MDEKARRALRDHPRCLRGKLLGWQIRATHEAAATNRTENENQDFYWSLWSATLGAKLSECAHAPELKLPIVWVPLSSSAVKIENFWGRTYGFWWPIDSQYLEDCYIGFGAPLQFNFESMYNQKMYLYFPILKCLSCKCNDLKFLFIRNCHLKLT